ncbi:MAG TPA: glycosyltransferase, partial [Methylomirabilota bacterium]|nr:glycosyltransferase [Methylomirabilota bacterium]
MHLDVVFAADPRFPGGTSSATLMDMRAVRRMGLTAGLLPVRSAVLSTVRGMHPRLRAGMEAAGIVPLAPDSPVTCDLLLAEHPTLFLYMADRPTLVRPRAAVLIANHPPRIGRTTPEYDLVEVLDNMERLFGVDAHVAPISPIVRDLILETPVRRDRITSSDLTRIIDVDDWAMPIRPPRAGEPVVIGRHGRPDPLKWPDTIEDVLAAYPVREDVRVHMLGGGPPNALMDHWPGSWRIQPFRVDHPKTFLEGIDFYVYFHSRAWIEAFGLSVLEAMAAGKVVIVSDSFRSLFGGGVLYATPADVMEIVDRLRDDPAAYVEQATRARAIAAERFSYPTFEAQFSEIRREIGAESRDETAPARSVARTPIADPPTAAAVPASPLPTRRLMLVSSNGIGLGHITRLAAIARRLPGYVEPVFYTLSQGASLLRDLGYNADFVPSHQARGFTGESWNRAFAHDFAAALEYHAPEAVVFDGSMPYTGLVDVLDARPRLTSFWMRRALWKPGQSEIALVRDMHFTAVIEPGDIAEREDVGTTVLGRQDVLRVPPILLHDATERLSRGDARRALDLPETGRIVCLQLGILGDTDLAPLRAA